MAGLINPYDSNGSAFKITELNLNSQGNLQDTTNTFTWNVDGQSKPREAWRTPMKLRTVRTDYSDKPTEQVLGPMYEDFTLTGLWDNKYNGGPDTDFAWTTGEAFKALWKRGNLCRFDFDDISIIGLIVSFEPEYFRRSRIGYKFTVSPHFDNADSAPRKAPQTAPSPQSYQQQVDQLIEQAQQRQAAAPAVYIVAGIFSTVDGHVNTMSSSIATIDSIIANRIIYAGPLTTNTTSVGRLVQEFSNLQSTANLMLVALDTATSGTDIVYQDAFVAITYQQWSRGIREVARQMIQVAYDAVIQFSKYIVSDMLALYSPQAEESLYGIATRFYGSPDQWRTIYLQNHLVSIVLDGTETLVIPKLTA
jgi:nucleoid-associated protein YgaU